MEGHPLSMIPFTKPEKQRKLANNEAPVALFVK